MPIPIWNVLNWYFLAFTRVMNSQMACHCEIDDLFRSFWWSTWQFIDEISTHRNLSFQFTSPKWENFQFWIFCNVKSSSLAFVAYEGPVGCHDHQFLDDDTTGECVLKFKSFFPLIEQYVCMCICTRYIA